MHSIEPPALIRDRNALASATNENTLMSMAVLKPSRLVL